MLLYAFNGVVLFPDEIIGIDGERVVISYIVSFQIKGCGDLR